jgi:hypothetical protein
MDVVLEDTATPVTGRDTLEHVTENQPTPAARSRVTTAIGVACAS